MAKAKKLPSGNWRVQAKRNGEKKSFTAPDKKTAEWMAIQWQNEKSAGKGAEMLLSDRVDIYIRARRNIVSPVTVRTYEGYKRRYLLELQEKRIKDITLTDFQIAVNDLSAELSPKSVKSVFGFFRSVLGEDMPKGKIILPRIYKSSYNTPDIENGKRILEIVKDTDAELPVNLALRCGLRISEICGLKWSSVHEDHIEINNVVVTFGKEQIEKLPKSAAGKRNIPITPDMKALIDRQPRINDYVVQKSSNAIRMEFTRILQKNGLPHIKFHELRHAFASNMALLGVPEAYAKAIGGWDTSAILHNIYEQTYEKQQEDFAKKMHEIYT